MKLPILLLLAIFAVSATGDESAETVKVPWYNLFQQEPHFIRMQHRGCVLAYGDIVPYEDVQCMDVDVSEDGKRWYHILGDRCIEGRLWIRNHCENDSVFNCG